MIFTTAFRKIARLKHKNKVIQGSQGAAKTYSILMRWIIKAIHSQEKQFCTIATDTFPALRSGAMKDFEDICAGWGVIYESTKNPSIYKINNWTFQFMSVDKEQKGRGGRRDRLFINEANRMPWETARQLIARTHVEVIIDFNPVQKFWAHTNFVDIDDCDFIKLTYKDNEALPQGEVDSIEKHAPWGAVPDENYWRVYGLGEIGFVEGVIYKYETFKEYPKTRMFKVVGFDFGWEDPMAAVMVHLDIKNKSLYWRELFYASHASHSSAKQAIKKDRSYNNEQVICDSSAPREIMSLRKIGLNAIGCGKKDLVSDIRTIKQYKLFIHEDSKNMRKEADNYSWQKNKLGGFNEYPDQNCEDHLMDAARMPSVILIGKQA
jgi:phage terminase large subunit